MNHAIGGIARLTLTGRISRGLGEGGLYVSLAEYREWFRLRTLPGHLEREVGS